MKKFILTLSVLVFSAVTIGAKDLEVTELKYSRNSLYSILVSHTDQKFASEIQSQFLAIPTPEQYNNHDLSVKVVSVNNNGKYTDAITRFVNQNQIGSRLIAKWFDRDILTGECSMNLIKERGIYNASELDKELAKRSTRGIAMLEDAGEELIGKTFLLVNEIKYIDKGKRSRLFGNIIQVVGAVAEVATGVQGLSDLGESVGDLTASLKGFKVKIHTRLYQLVWDEETANTFYTLYYSSKPDEEKRKAFEQNRDKFKMKFVGEVESDGSTTSFMGINEDEPLLMVRKACQRAIDDNIADLQKEYDQFRIKAPIVSVEPTIQVQIGLKEGITKDSKFEVLEAQEKDGRVEYKRVGIIKPVPSKIWDNRYMASEEGAYGADFGATTFKKESGKDFYPGLLVRQIE
ncbi:MAG: hypothetical protein IJ342_00900 [Muribaculaceae bacterium]|nr:hypothetical protein [Muribaculaceae bacterium]